MTVQSDHRAFAPATVLVVDDDSDALRLLSHQIRQRFGDSVSLIEEQNSKQAAAIVESRPIQLVVTDLDMADKNGFHLLKTAKSFDPLTQVVIVTGHHSGNAVRSALQLGADEFIVKPYKPDDLLNAVDYLIGRVNRWSATVTEGEEIAVENL